MSKAVENQIKLAELKERLEEVKNSIRKCLYNGDHVRTSFFMKQADEISYQIKSIEVVDNSMVCIRKNKDMDLWIGKTIMGIVTLSDLTNSYVMNYKAFFESLGLEPRDELKKAIDDMSKALYNLRNEYAKYLEGNARTIPLDNFMLLEDLIAKTLFTDREMIYYNKYSRK